MDATAASLDHSVALLSAPQMAQADRLTVAGGISGIALMENAGRPVAQAIQQRGSSRPLPVLCGPAATVATASWWRGAQSPSRQTASNAQRQ